MPWSPAEYVYGVGHHLLQADIARMPTPAAGDRCSFRAEVGELGGGGRLDPGGGDTAHACAGEGNAVAEHPGSHHHQAAPASGLIPSPLRHELRQYRERCIHILRRNRCLQGIQLGQSSWGGNDLSIAR